MTPSSNRGQSPRAIEPRQGDPISARILGDAARKFNQFFNGIRVPFSNTGTASVVVSFSARVEEVKGDYLVCVRADEDVDGNIDVQENDTEFNVLKPRLLRRSTFEGKTRGDFTYTFNSDIERVSTGGDTETQVIVPLYEEETDIIIVHPAPVGQRAYLDEDEEPIVWIDSNNDGRMWGKQS